MDIKIESLMPFDTIKTDVAAVFSVVDKNGKVVLLKDNQPAYVKQMPKIFHVTYHQKTKKYLQ